MRGEDGGLRAFLNVCRHRGAQLCPTERGETRTLQCRYHAWTYGLDGRLLRRPGSPGLGGFDRGAFGLVPVALDTWEGLVWVNLAERPAAARWTSSSRSSLTGSATPAASPPTGSARSRSPGRSSTRSAPTGRSSSRTSWSATTARRCTRSSCGSCRPSGAGRRRSTGSGTRLADDAEALTVSGRGRGTAVPGPRAGPRAALLRDGRAAERAPESPPRPRHRPHADAARRRTARGSPATGSSRRTPSPAPASTPRTRSRSSIASTARTGRSASRSRPACARGPSRRAGSTSRSSATSGASTTGCSSSSA